MSVMSAGPTAGEHALPGFPIRSSRVARPHLGRHRVLFQVDPQTAQLLNMHALASPIRNEAPNILHYAYRKLSESFWFCTFLPKGLMPEHQITPNTGPIS